MTRTERATQMLAAFAAPVVEWPTKFNRWLTALPTVQYQVFVASFPASGTCVVVWVCMLKQIPIDHVTLAELLAFIAALSHISYRAFKTKRETYNPDLPTKQNQKDAAVETFPKVEG